MTSPHDLCLLNSQDHDENFTWQFGIWQIILVWYPDVWNLYHAYRSNHYEGEKGLGNCWQGGWGQVSKPPKLAGAKYIDSTQCVLLQCWILMSENFASKNKDDIIQDFLETSQCSMEQARKPHSYTCLKPRLTGPLTCVECRATRESKNVCKNVKIGSCSKVPQSLFFVWLRRWRKHRIWIDFDTTLLLAGFVCRNQFDQSSQTT